MKIYIQSLLSAIVISFLNSCGGSEDASPAYDFKDQNMKGTIDGISWQVVSGKAEVSTSANDKYFLNFSEKTIDNACNDFVFDGNRVFFSIPNAVGLYELQINTSTGDGQTATLFKGSEFLNIIATEGAIEILTITDALVTGRIDAKADSESSVNGNFSVPLCK